MSLTHAQLSAKLASLPEDVRMRIIESLVPRMPGNYVPHTPHPTQQAFLNVKAREAMFGGAASGGKLLRLTEPLLTTTGWKTQGTVEVGDQVYGHDGNPVTVLAVSDVMQEDCYELEFSTGERIIAGEQHRWVMQTDRDRQSLQRTDPDWQARRRASRPSRAKGAASLKPGTGAAATVNNAARATSARATAAPANAWDYTRILETHEVAALAKTERKRLSVIAAPPINTPGKWTLKTAPWALGMWLGDGTTKSSAITHGNEDADNLIASMAAAGYTLADRNGTRFVFDGLAPHITADIGAPSTRRKHIPDAVYTAPHVDRLAVAQGLIDSDGHINARGQVEFCLTDETLFTDCIRLFATLGIRVSQTTSKAGYTKDGIRHDTGMRYRAKFTSHLPLATYARKLNRIVLTERPCTNTGKTGTVQLVSIKPTATVPTRCIQVSDPRGVYLVGNTMVATHNSDALLMAALQYVDIPGYAALILRRTYADLTLPGAIMDRANAWLTGTDAKKKDGGVTWIFPSGARLTFGYLQRESDRYRYQGAEFQFVGMDELTQFPSEDMYTYLFSRLRKPQLSCVVCDIRIRPVVPGANKGGAFGFTHDTNNTVYDAPCSEAVPDFAMISEYSASQWDGKTTLFDVPLRMRSATNPGGTGGEWVRRRFVDPKTRTKEAVFVPSFIKDNPSVNTEEYVKSLDYLHPVERERLLEGSWEAMEAGEFFRREWFNYSANPPTTGNMVRAWDMAATAGGGDWTVGTLMGEHNGRYYVHDVVRGQWSPGDSERIVQSTAASDGVGVHIRMEQEGGSAGKTVIAHYQRLLTNYSFRGMPSSGSKEARATPLAVAAQKGLVYLKPAEWNRQWLDEFTVFPKGAHDDTIDSATLAYNSIAGRRQSRILV